MFLAKAGEYKSYIDFKKVFICLKSWVQMVIFPKAYYYEMEFIFVKKFVVA